MTRIVAGAAGGRRIAVPPGSTTRPTSDRAREALFSTLVSLRGPFDAVRVADLYAGSGALGLEALSRGAAHALLVDADARVVSVLHANVEAVGLPGAIVRHDRAARVVAAAPDAPYDVVFLDPPYAEPVDRVTDLVAALGDGWLASGAAVVVERSSREDALAWPEGFDVARDRAYGEARVAIALWYGRRS